jgi:S-adenosylmethionine/arginine decarboxylase-like enzyme
MIEHKHLIVRAELDWFYQKHQSDNLYFWFKDLIKDMDMNIMSGPYLAYNEKPGLEGWSGVCIIETSHVALHVWDREKPVIAQLDVYTCGSLESDVIYKYLNKFNVLKHDAITLDREHKIEIL